MKDVATSLRNRWERDCIYAIIEILTNLGPKSGYFLYLGDVFCSGNYGMCMSLKHSLTLF